MTAASNIRRVDITTPHDVLRHIRASREALRQDQPHLPPEQHIGAKDALVREINWLEEQVPVVPPTPEELEEERHGTILFPRVGPSLLEVTKEHGDGLFVAPMEPVVAEKMAAVMAAFDAVDKPGRRPFADYLDAEPDNVDRHDWTEILKGAGLGRAIASVLDDETPEDAVTAEEAEAWGVIAFKVKAALVDEGFVIARESDYTGAELTAIVEKDRRALSAYLHQHEGHALDFTSEHTEDGGDALLCSDCDRIDDGVELNGLLHSPTKEQVEQANREWAK